VAGRRSGAPARVVLPLAAATVLAEVAYPLVHGGARARLTVVTVVLFAATSLAHARVSRGWRAAAALLVVFAGGGLAVEAVGVATGWPFGRYAYAGTLGPQVAGVPLVIPLGWLMMAWPSYLVAVRLVAGRAARVLLAGWALASWDLFLDPQMVAAGHWRWADPSPSLPGVGAVPLTNYAGWLLASVVLMGLLDAVARAEPGTHDLLPCVLYLWTYASSVLAHLAFLGLPASAGWGALGMGTVAVPLALALRRRASSGVAA
jgi:carotene biosynthesis associated membrane protein